MNVDAVAKMEAQAAVEEQAAQARLASKPQSSHNKGDAAVAAVQPQSRQVQ